MLNVEIVVLVKDVFEECRTILDPSGALALAGAKTYVHTLQTMSKLVQTLWRL